MVLLLALGGPGGAWAQTVTICPPGDPTCSLHSVQEALAYGANHVIVSPGTYPDESATVYDPNVIIESEDPLDPGILQVTGGSIAGLTIYGNGTEVRDLVYDLTSGSEARQAIRVIGATGVVLDAVQVYGGRQPATVGTQLLLDAAQVQATDCVFSDASAWAGGAVALVNASSLEMVDGSVDGSDAGSDGGGILVDHDGQLDVKGTSFQDNAADGKGGHIAALWGSVVALEDVVMRGGGATSGGAVFSSGAGATLEIDGGTFEGNRADDGGAVMSLDAALVDIDESAVSQAQFLDNRPGGAVVSAGTPDVVIAAAVFEANDRDGGGGAVRVQDAANLHIDNTWFCDNEAGSGGALEVVAGCSGVDGCEIEASVFQHGRADSDGGAMRFVGVFGRLEVHQNTMLRNDASNAGGAVHLETGVLDFHHNLMISNSSGDAAVDGNGTLLGDRNAWWNNTMADVAPPMQRGANDVVLQSAPVLGRPTKAPNPCGDDVYVVPGQGGANDQILTDDIGFGSTDNDDDLWPEAWDCDDSDSEIHAQATEIVGNDTDEDCDGFFDCFTDNDGDGFGQSEVKSVDGGCFATEGVAVVDSDCDDTDASVHPNGVEIPNNDIDEDCDGADLFDPSYVDPEDPTRPTDPCADVETCRDWFGGGGGCGCSGAGGGTAGAGILLLALLTRTRRR